MTVTLPLGTTVTLPLSGWERREAVMLRVVPHCALAVSLVLVLLDRAGSFAHLQAMVGLTLAASSWSLFMNGLGPAWTQRPSARAVFFAGFTALSAALVFLSPLYGFFAWSGYLQVTSLPGRWKWAGVMSTAAIVSTTYVGGVQNVRGSGAVIFGVFTAAGIALGGGFLFFNTMIGRQNARQRVMLGDLAETNAQLEAALAENAGLHAQLLAQAREAGVLDERARMAREIHDTLAQGFTGIVAQLEAARQNPGQWRRFADQAQALARDNLAEARRSVAALRPGQLEGAHLPEAIAGMSERWSQTSGVAVGVETTGEPRPLLADVEVALFRVAQEALTNVAKHAKASRVGLTLSYMEDVVLLDVRDDGIGFEPRDIDFAGQSGFGLSSMRQRLLRVAGSLAIESGPGEGTAVNASVPALPAGGGA
ncbi:sensor histidine kinase [Actinomadura sp. DC4]|uniref:sensor histidine kinase n=1 Tax=Actinomadura sp. DC4 TaxID=3055069 RepID=UPI0025AFC64C|nr:sensor histidine kinase [Actinomadura sp. DC4]MDN3351295.1 sensor histidine kinase [Actinomadura sp. DC4]